MAALTRAAALLGAAVLVWAPARVAAQTPADVEACNQHAQAVASGGPSASPGPGLESRPAAGGGLGPSGGAASGGSTMTSPGTSSDANRLPNVTGRISGSAGSPGTAVGTTSGGLSGAPGASRSTGTSGPGTGGGTTSGGDARLGGMAPAGTTNEAYRQAYRDCMRSRGY